MNNPKHTSSDLVKRLRAFDYNVDIAMFYDKDPECVSEAADRIEALEAENERLRGRLAHAEDDCEDACIYCEERRQEIAIAARRKKQ